MERKIDRMLAYLKYKGISENKATVDCGLAKGLIYQAKSGKADIGAKAIEKVLATYTDMSSIWLLTGEGSMLNSDQQENPAEDQPAAGSSLVEYLERKIKELEREKADLLQENAVLRYENQKLTPRKGDAEDAVVSLSAGAV